MSLYMLKNIYLFKDFDVAESEQITALGTSKKLKAGEKLFAQGDVATALYIIKSGSIRISHSTDQQELLEIAVLGAGSHFGEMAFIDGEKRSATCEALEDSEIFSLNYSDLNLLLSNFPILANKFYKAISVFLAGRLRNTTNDLTFARQLNFRHF
jgi:CRP/FNR family cyclic AMP-dependent transcriptional regulator